MAGYFRFTFLSISVFYSTTGLAQQKFNVTIQWPKRLVINKMGIF